MPTAKRCNVAFPSGRDIVMTRIFDAGFCKYSYWESTDTASMLSIISLSSQSPDLNMDSMC